MELKLILEALLFVADRPLTPVDLRGVLVKAAEQSQETQTRALRKVKIGDIDAALQALAQEVESAGRSYRLVCVAGGWQFVVLPEYAAWLRALAGERARPGRLSLPALETLAIIAYRQPITRVEMEQIRGVSVDGVMQTLLERGLIEPAGRAEVAGRPMMYVTTKSFLEYFGLAGLTQLPDADELRRVPVERPPGLVTAEPGLATVPPEQLATPMPETDNAPPDSTTAPDTTAQPPAPAATEADEPKAAPPASSASKTPISPGTPAEPGAEPGPATES